MRIKGFTLMETVIFIVLAAIVIPIFYLTTQPVIKNMMTPTAYIKARFVAERKMEELIARPYNDAMLNAGTYGPSYVTTDTLYPAGEYAGYQWQYTIDHLGCGASGAGCGGYYNVSNPVVSYTSDQNSNYKQIDLIVSGQGVTYEAVSVVTARY